MAVIMIGTLWIAGIRAPWSPKFEARPLPVEVVGVPSRQALRGAQVFYAEGCQYCHAVAGYGGQRGPNLTNVAERLPAEQITIAILDGRTGMPSYAGILAPEEVQALVAFLQSVEADAATKGTQ